LLTLRDLLQDSFAESQLPSGSRQVPVGIDIRAIVRDCCGSGQSLFLFVSSPQRGSLETEMRFARIRVLLALAVAVLLGYVLDRGIYIGSVIRQQPTPGTLFYTKYCRYLHLSGIHEDFAVTEMNRSAVENSQHLWPPLGAK
jgi:hypothetical protein